MRERGWASNLGLVVACLSETLLLQFLYTTVRILLVPVYTCCVDRVEIVRSKMHPSNPSHQSLIHGRIVVTCPSTSLLVITASSQIIAHAAWQ